MTTVAPLAGMLCMLCTWTEPSSCCWISLLGGCYVCSVPFQTPCSFEVCL